jgi:hypothetical protein
MFLASSGAFAQGVAVVRNDCASGSVVVEVRSDVAPKASSNVIPAFSNVIPVKMGIQESLGLDSTYLSGSEINAANGVSVVRKSDEFSSWDKRGFLRNGTFFYACL